MLVDKSDDGLAALFHLLLVMRIELEGDGVTFELLFVHIAVCLVVKLMAGEPPCASGFVFYSSLRGGRTGASVGGAEGIMGFRWMIFMMKSYPCANMS